MSDSNSEITFEMNAFYPQSPAVPITNPYTKNNPRKRNKARQDLGSKSCDVMRDSNSEITFKMNAFYPQISGQAFEKNRGGKEYVLGARNRIERGRSEIFGGGRK